jgi:DNA-binding CsgD family transcriptional regulator
VPARKRKADLASDSESAPGFSAQLEKITRLLALLAVKGESQSEKIKVLSGAGFSNTEIAELLGLTPNSVNVALHRLRAKR